MKMKCVLGKSALLLFLAFIMQVSLQAGINKITIQGMITGSDGVTPSTGTHELTFNMYDAATGGTLYYAEKQTVDLAASGLFNCMLGSGTIQNPPNVSLDTVAFDKQYYIAIKVDSESELADRQILGASAYALGSTGNFNVAKTSGGVNSVEVNAGIGTSNPTAKMEVVSSSQDVRIRIQSTNTGGSETAGVKLADAGGDEWSLYYSNALKGLVVNEEGLVPRMFIKDGGNVGIGNSNPGYNLEIDSSNPALNIKDSGNNRNLRMQIVNDGSEITSSGTYMRIINANSNTGEIRFRTTSSGVQSDKVVMKNNGYIFFGDSTTTPTQPLCVTGSNEAIHSAKSRPGAFSFIGYDETLKGGRAGAYDWYGSSGEWRPLILQQFWGTLGGSVGIGTGNNIPPADSPLCMETFGGGYYSTINQDWNKGSSLESIKVNIADYQIPGIMDTLKGIKIKKYQYKDNVVIKNAEGKEIGTELKEPPPDKPYCIGYLAEEVPSGIKGLVISNEGNISIGSSFSYLVLVCQEKQKEIETLKTDISSLKSKLK